MLRALVLLALFATTHVWGQLPVVAPEVTAAQLDEAVARVTANLPESDPQRALLLKLYADTGAALASFELFSQQINSYSKARSNALQEAQVIEEELAQTHLSPPPADTSWQDASLPELEHMIQLAKSELDASKNQLTAISAAIDAMPGRAIEIRARLTELAGLATELNSRLDTAGNTSGSGSVDEAALWLAGAKFASVNVERAALEEELLSQTMRLQLLKAQLDQTSYRITRLEKRSRAMVHWASNLRQGEATQAQVSADRVLADAQGKHAVVRQLADENAALTQTFSARIEEIERADDRDDDIRSAAEQLEFDLKSAEHKLALLGMNTVFGEILRDRQAQLPRRGEILKQISENSDAIRASSLRQIKLEDERRLLRDPDEYSESLVEGLAPALVTQIKSELNDLLYSRRELVRRAIDLENTYARTAGDLDFSLRRYEAVVTGYRDFIAERLLWIPSRDLFGLFDGETDLFAQTHEIFVPERWQTVLQQLAGQMRALPLNGVLLLVVLVLVYYGPRLKRQLVATGRQVGTARDDTFSSTLHALGLSVLLSLKWPLLMLAAAWLFELQDEESELATALYVSLLRVSLYFWGLEFLRFALQPQGLMNMHFRWPDRRVSALRRAMVTLELTLIPAALLVGFFLNLYPRSVGGSLGSLAVVMVLSSIAHFIYRLPEFVYKKMAIIIHGKPSVEHSLWAKLLRKLLFWIPVVTIFAVFFGYTFTAIEISLLLVRTFILLSCILILHELGLRWLGLTRRRMAYEIRQELVRNIDDDGDDDGDVAGDDEIMENDRELLSYEGTKLLNLLTLFGGVLGLVWIWAEVFPALGSLNSVSLWQQTSIVDGREIIHPVTLAKVFKALLFAALGWLAIRRIPGLFEIFLRQKLDVTPASAYALTRLFQYASSMLLVIFVLGALGVSWSSLQWAVAALSLGIGFGLQEIVANFISGLIILFEQPIRLGDTITVGDISGTVTRIQMRATTIRDFDRRELLVPNKEVITTRLVNWSLSDTVTRRLIRMGVAHGTDMDQAMDIVRDVAGKHPSVMKTPEAVVTFDELGENSQLICLRYFLEKLEGRRIVDSELRLQISRRFKEAGIVIAHPQRDIHIDTMQPLEIKILEAGAGY